MLGFPWWRESLRTNDRSEAEKRLITAIQRSNQQIEDARRGTLRLYGDQAIRRWAYEWHRDCIYGIAELDLEPDFYDGLPEDDEIREALERSVGDWVSRKRIRIRRNSGDWECLIRQCRAEWEQDFDPEDDPLPFVELEPAAGNDRSLTRAFEKYIQEKRSDISERTRQEWETAVARFISVHGNMPVDEIQRDDIDSFRQLLLRMPSRPKDAIRRLGVPNQVAWAEQKEHPRLAPGTVAKNVTAIKVILDFAFHQTAMIAGDARLSWRNPCAGFVMRSKKQVNTRRPFKDEHVRVIFDPMSYRTTNPSRFWIPLLLHYTGARLNEIGQLLLSDVHLGEIAYLRLQTELDDEDEEVPNAAKNVKSAAGARTVPLHDDVLRVGFADYVEHVRQSGYTHLFPDLPHHHGRRRAKKISSWFRRYRSKVGLAPKKYVLHSFRHAFRTRAQRAEGVWEPMVRMVQGHSLGRDVASGVYGWHDRSEPLVLKERVIDRLPFPELEVTALAEIGRGLRL